MRKEKKARACLPPPLLCEFALPLGRKGHKVGDNTKAGSPLIHSNKGCVPYCLSLAASSPLIPSSNSALCARAGVEIGGNEHRASERGQTKTEGRRGNLSLAGIANGGTGAGMRRRRRPTHTASERASGECSSGGDVTAPRKMPGIDVTVLSQPASACNSAHSLARTRSFDPGKRKMALSQHTHTHFGPII
jgi:hypothetical protein